MLKLWSLRDSYFNISMCGTFGKKNFAKSANSAYFHYIPIRSAQPNITYLYYPILSKIEEENHQDFDKNIYLFRFIWVRRVLVWASKEGAGNQPEDFIKLTRTHGEHGMLLRRDATKGRICSRSAAHHTAIAGNIRFLSSEKQKAEWTSPPLRSRPQHCR